jgi:hypothetical protein
MGKKSDTHLDNVMMLALGITILLMGVGTRDLMRDANITKKELNFSYSPPQSDWAVIILRSNRHSTRR